MKEKRAPRSQDLGFNSVNDMNEAINEAIKPLGISLHISWSHPSGHWVIFIDRLEEKDVH